MDQELLRLYENLGNKSNLRTAYITPKVSESNHLEFKQKSDSRNPVLSENDKYHFSKALSSFSNADGGLLIWGVSTRKRDGRDYASALKPIAQVEAFVERLRDSLIDTIMPRNHNVMIKALTNRQGNGFVVCMIPSGNDVPVRAMNADREYWVRTDGRTMRLEHYQIKDMMLRHAHPDLELKISISDQGLPPDQVAIYFGLLNHGKALAKHWGYLIQAQSIKLLKIDQCNDVSSLNPGRTVVSNDGGFNSVIHPNNISIRVGSITIQRKEHVQNLALDAKWYCEDMNVKELVYMLTIDPVSTSPSTSK